MSSEVDKPSPGSSCRLPVSAEVMPDACCCLGVWLQGSPFKSSESEYFGRDRVAGCSGPATRTGTNVSALRTQPIVVVFAAAAAAPSLAYRTVQSTEDVSIICLDLQERARDRQVRVPTESVRLDNPTTGWTADGEETISVRLSGRMYAAACTYGRPYVCMQLTTQTPPSSMARFVF